MKKLWATLKDGSVAVKAVVCAALGNIIWGFSFLFTKVGLAVAPDPNVMLAHRFTLATLFMCLLMLAGKGRLSFKGKNWKPVTILLAMQLSYYLFESYGVLHTNATVSGLVLALVPIVTIGTGALFLKEYPTLWQGLFCIMPVAGVIIMTISGAELGVITPLGVLFLVLTLLSSAFYKTANRKVAQEFTPFERTFMVLAISAVFFTISGLGAVKGDIGSFVAPLAQPKYLGSVLSLSLLCSIVANMLVNYASGNMSVFKVSAFGSLSTLCSTVAGVLILGEPISWMLAVGAVLILVGIRLVTWQRGEPKLKDTTLCYVRQDGRTLLLHRVKKENDLNHDKWIGVGGKFEKGEDAEACLLREVREETGLTLTSYAYRGVVTFRSTKWDDERMHLFTADGFTGQLKDCDEGELEWVDDARVPTLPTWEGDRLFLELLWRNEPFFEMELAYDDDDKLVSATVDGAPYPRDEII